MGNKHNESCECCKDLSPLAKSVLNEIDGLLSGIKGAVKVNAPGFKTIEPLSEEQEVLNALTELNLELGGQITDILNLTKYFYSLNFSNINLANLKVDDPKKKLGKFKLSDVTDNPSIDVSKFLDFKMFDISKFNKLKISLTVPTLIIEKNVGIGPVSLGIKFMISLVEVSWMPAVSVDFDSIKKALSSLKDSATSQQKLIGPADGKSISQLKDIAKKQFADDPSILGFLLPLNNVDDFFKALKEKGLNLIEEVNIADVAAQIVANAEKGQQLADAKLLADIGIPIKDIDKILKDLGNGKISNADLGTMELCPVRVPAKPTSPPFTEDDIAAVTQCAVDLKKQEVVELTDTPEVAEFDSLLSQLPKDPQQLIDDMNNFLSEIDKHNKEMQICSKDKEDAKNKLYSFKQAYILHDFVHKYVAKRYNATKPEVLNAPYIAFYKERDRLTNLLSEKVAEKTTLTAGSTSQPANPKVAAVDSEIQKLQNDLSTLTSKFENTRTEFEVGLKAELLKESVVSADTFTQRLTALRSKAKAENNPLSNLVGFDENSMSFVLYADSAIIKELKDIENNAKSTGVTMMFSDYFRENTHVFTVDPANPKPLRLGLIEDVWRLYYSPNRIDNLFTWKEQGYTAPKPVYDDKGNVVSTMTTVSFVNGQGVKTEQQVPQSVKDCNVDISIAVPFLENLEDNIEAKMEKLINDVLNGKPAQDYINKVLKYAELEAKIKYAEFLFTLNFNENLNIFDTNTPLEFVQSYQISEAIYNSLSEKSNIILKTIDKCKTCIAKKKKNIAEAGSAFAKIASVDSGSAVNGKEDLCKKKKGIDPFGIKPGSGECPNFTKNCYWKEYTKLLQTVSLMPIPDTEFLYKRLFRYYPVPLQIPIAPLAIPTLALGVPDVTISIPLPFLWVHLLSVQTPLGLFVMWLGLAGGFIPNPYVMLIDEKQQSSFIFTPKGITPIPAKQLMMSPMEGKSLLDLLPGYETLLKLDLSMFGKLAAGSTRGDSTNPDNAKNVITNIKDDIQKAVDGLEIPDPSWGRENDRAKRLKAKIKRVTNFTTPNTEEIPSTFKDVLEGILESATKAIDKINLPAQKIPKNSKAMLTELPSFLELKQTYDKLAAAASNGPAETIRKINGDIGKSLTVFDVNKEINTFIRSEMEKPEVKFKFIGVNQRIDELETNLSVNVDSQTIEAKAEAIKERTKKVKEVILLPVQSLADSITPAMLGFLGYADSVPPLPFPCYTNVSLPAVPPEVAAAVALIKSLPSVIKSISDDEIANLLKAVIDLSLPLPTAEDLFFKAVGPLLSKVPRLVIPTGFKDNLMKLIIKSIKDFILQFKVRLPKPGLPTQIIIPPQVIKTIIKEAIKIAFGVIIGVLLNYVNEILQKVGPEKAAAIIALLAVIKLMFGTDLHKVTGKDIKAFLNMVIKSAVFPALDALKPTIDTANAVKSGFKSIMELFTLPDINILNKKEGPFLELKTKEIKKYVDPLLYQVVPVVANALPFPVVLLAASTTPGRLALTKIDPRKAIEKLPNWEGLSLKNIPLLLFLDQLAATAQRTAILNSDYLPPYFTPVTP